MKAHIGVDAGAGYIHSVSATAASVHDLDEVTKLVRADDEVVYTDAGYQGVDKRGRSLRMSTCPGCGGGSRRARARSRRCPPTTGLWLTAGLGAREGGAPVPDRQTRLPGSPRPATGDGQEPEPSAHAVRLRELADALACRCPDRVTGTRDLPGNATGNPKDPEKGRCHHENRPNHPDPDPAPTGHP